MDEEKRKKEIIASLGLNYRRKIRWHNLHYPDYSGLSKNEQLVFLRILDRLKVVLSALGGIEYCTFSSKDLSFRKISKQEVFSAIEQLLDKGIIFYDSEKQIFKMNRDCKYKFH